MSSIPLPALDVKPPQQPSILDQFQHVAALRNLMQGQQLQQQQIQGAQLDNQLRQRQVQDQQAMTTAMQQWDGKDINDLPGLVLKNNGSAQAVLGLKNQLVDYNTKIQGLTKDQLANEATKNDAIAGHIDYVKSLPPEQQPQAFETAKQDLVQKGYLDPRQAQGMQYLGPQQLDTLEKLSMSHSQQVDQALKGSEQQANSAKAANENTQAALNQIKLNMAKNSKPGDFDSQIDQVFNPQQNAGSNRMAKAMVNGALSRGDFEGAKQILDQAYQSQQDVQKEIQINTNPQIQAGKAATAAKEAQATQPYKIEQAAAEGKARQLIQGMTEPVYAYVSQTGGPPQKTLMSKTDALQAGIKTMLPVTEKEVGDDTMLINRLSDVHQKISRYENAMQQWNMNANDRAAIQRLTQTDKFKLGIWGAEVPVDEFNKALDQLHISNLSPQARDAVVAYYNAHEAMVGYNRVLSGSGKSSDKALQLQGDTLPDISTADHDMAARGFRDFKENLNVVGQGLPKIPGVKSPEEWEQGLSPQSNPRQFPPVNGVTSLRSLLGGQ